MRYLLDTSAILALFFKEPGFEAVAALIGDSGTTVFFSVLSILEIEACLEQYRVRKEMGEAWITSLYQVTQPPVPVSAEVVQSALMLRRTAGKRIPGIDALIAGTAICERATLVHRDLHMAAIPLDLLPPLGLPPKFAPGTRPS
jgi:predicted nucleic acid-binding protein